jgi:hypothetical protein
MMVSLQFRRSTSALVMLTFKFRCSCKSSTTDWTERTEDASIKAPFAVKIRQFGPRLHLPKQFTPKEAQLIYLTQIFRRVGHQRQEPMKESKRRRSPLSHHFLFHDTTCLSKQKLVHS